MAQKRMSTDGPGLGHSQDFQRCVAALWRRNRKRGTHQQGVWNLPQGDDENLARLILLGVEDSA